MNDEFLRTAWRKPTAAFAQQLREHLRELDSRSTPAGRRRMPWRHLAYAASILVALALLAFPSVRAEVGTFLDLFRVESFAAVPVQPAHLQALLADQTLDLPHLLGKQVRLLQAPGAPRPAASADEAQALAGTALHWPAWTPVGLNILRIEVVGEQRWSVTASAQKLEQVLAAEGIDDLTVPDGIDGQTATIDIPPIVRATYGSSTGHAVLIQARRPEVSFPAGVDLQQLAEIGLRVLGVGRDEAHRFAGEIDWHTTLVVPVLADVSAFRQVDIQGRTGLLVQTSRPARTGMPSAQSQLLWSKDRSVFALVGDLRPDELIEMAQSMP